VFQKHKLLLKHFTLTDQIILSMKKTNLLFFALALGIAPSMAQTKPTPKKTTTAGKTKVVAKPATEAAKGGIKFTEYTLPNGLQVILHQDNSTPLVATTVMYHVGSKNERPGRSGFAHFFEHLMFEGSANIGRGEFPKIIKANGGQNNANTSFDRTFYYEIFPSNKLELGLYLESERLLHAKVDEEGVKTQREVVKEESRQRYENSPYGQFLPEILRNSYTAHAYKIPPIGTMNDLNAAKIEEFREFYKEFYVPNNAILSIAGDINIEETKKLVAKYFAEIPRGTLPMFRNKIVEPVQTAERRATFYDNIQLPAVMLSYHTPPQDAPDSYSLNMLNTLLASGGSSRLKKELVEKQQKAVAVGAFPMSTEDPGLVIAYSIANMGQAVDSLENAMLAEIEKIKTEGLTDKEFEKLQNQIENDFVNGKSEVAEIAEALANYKMYYGNANLINTELERYQKIKKEDIVAAAKKYFTKENRTVLHYLPMAMKPKN
jgi:zinc protease